MNFDRHLLVGPKRGIEEQRKFQIGFLKNQGLKPHHTFLDIGCGTLRGGIPIIDYLDVGKYFGIEARTNVLDEAIKELEENNLVFKTPTLIHNENFDELSVHIKFDYVFANSVIFHLSDELVSICFDFIFNNTAETGKGFFNVRVGDRYDGFWKNGGFPFVVRPRSTYERLLEQSGLKIIGEFEMHDKNGHIMLEVSKKK